MPQVTMQPRERCSGQSRKITRSHFRQVAIGQTPIMASLPLRVGSFWRGRAGSFWVPPPLSCRKAPLSIPDSVCLIQALAQGPNLFRSLSELA